MPERIPLDLVLAGRDLTEPRLAPAGELVVFAQRIGRVPALMSVPVDGGPERRVDTGPPPAVGRGMGGGCFDWLPDGSGVVYAAADGELWRQPVAGGATRLTDLGRTARAPAVAQDGAFVVFAVDEAEVWSADLRSGSTRRLDDGGDEFCFDPSMSPDGSVVAWQAWSPPHMPWDAAHVVTCSLGPGGAPSGITRWRPDGAAVQQPRFLPSGESACVHDASGWLNVQIDSVPACAEPFEQAGPTWGMGQRSFVGSPDGGRIAFARNEAGFGRLCVVERDTGEVAGLGKGDHGQLSWRGDRIVALRSGAVTPTQIVSYDVSDPRMRRRTVLAVGPGLGWDEHELPEPTLVEAAAGDGLVLHARRYAAGRGRLLCWVHGGPTDQWTADFRPRVSYWWSRGWDVLVVDPRGTTGHGRVFQQALNGGWGRLDVDDTATLIRHAHDAGWASPSTTVVTGGSSGGLTVLGVLIDHADVLAGGITSYPVSDLIGLADTDHRFELHYTDTLVGPRTGDGWRDRYVELSPLHSAGRIAAPLLIFHGLDDEVVPVEQSRRIADAIEASGGDVELVLYDGEGHGFRDPDNVRDEYERTERFLLRVTSPTRPPA